MSFCHYYDSELCRSCELIEQPYSQQLQQKNDSLQQILEPFHPAGWLAPVSGATTGFRNKAKMVASPSVNGVVLGLSAGRSLTNCPLYDRHMQRVLQQVQGWLREIGGKAYNVKRKSGELKYVLLTRSSHDNAMMLRFVLRSTSLINKLQQALDALLRSAPLIKVVSVNIQPVHMAILEGDEEIFLTQQTHLEERLNNLPLFIRPKGFFQTNPEIAARLYSTAAEWVNQLQATQVMDLFCGVGGFALHVAKPGRTVIGIEIEPEAIACAQESARLSGIDGLSFQALDANHYSAQTSTAPDVLIVNPPRRGLGEELCGWVEGIGPAQVVYSSCNAQSLAKDLALMPSYRLQRVQLFDMFPHTRHFETLVLLVRGQGS